MLLKITESCTMGCTHCINDAKPCDRHMTEETLVDAVKFMIENGPVRHIVLSGGEPTEHPEFAAMVAKLMWKLKYNPRIQNQNSFCAVTITTNGFWCIDHPDTMDKLTRLSSDKVVLLWQVSTDKRFYPKELNLTKKVWRKPNVTLCTDCVEALYPQGRARNMQYQAKASKCFNLRAITKQLYDRSHNVTLAAIINYMEACARKFCTPAIHYDGSIGLGESDLCPAAASIYDRPEGIVKKILDFDCHQCDFINEKLPKEYIALIRKEVI